MTMAALEKQKEMTHLHAHVPEGSEPFVLQEFLKKHPQLLYVALDDVRLERLSALIGFFLPEVEVVRFPAWDCIPYDRVSPNVSVVNARMQALSRLASLSASAEKKPLIVLTTVNAFIQKTPPKDVLATKSLLLRIGDTMPRERLQAFLVDNGYVNVGNANEGGEFAVRGSIIDIVPPGSEEGYRLDFFDTALESIRLFDPLTQISSGKAERLSLVPASEVLLSQEAIERFRLRYRQLFGTVQTSDPLYEAASDGRKYAGMEHWLPLFYERLDPLSAYLPQGLLVLDHLAHEAWGERQALIKDSYGARLKGENQKEVTGSSYHPVPPEQLYEMERDIDAVSANAVHFTPFDDPNAEVAHPFKAGEDYHKKAQEVQKPVLDLLKDELNASKHKLHLIGAASEGSASRLQRLLADHDVPHRIAYTLKEAKAALRKNAVALTILPIERGVRTDTLTLISEADLLGERIFRKTKKRRKSENFLSELASIEKGELIVHKEHGIGRFEGLETLTVVGESHDFILLYYANDDKLYVPMENIDLISRYGGNPEEVMLDGLGGAAWQKRTANVRKRIRLTAKELMEIAARRQLREAPIYQANSSAYEEFCARFPYTETDDQLSAIEDVLNDLASGRPMDRLVCGDVGFGKTEVALRAAFVVVNPEDGADEEQGKVNAMLSPPPLGGRVSEGVLLTEAAPSPQPLRSVASRPLKGGGVSSELQLSSKIEDENPQSPTPNPYKGQVALIAPTTLLCRQHYQTFKKRFQGLGVEIRELSRLVSAAQLKETKEALAEGKVDIVIGTHALLSKDVHFLQLGLVIVDEEQRFGVKQKEKLKRLRANTHVLTLTATPIPRTLQLSMTGIRDLSLITTPPVDRLAVRTFVMPYDGVVIREAILREHYRGGRTFFVCPRIKDVEEIEPKLRALVPEVKLAVGHGQMPGETLDRVMNAFSDGQYDVLLCTTIIESGIDISAANTLIIHRADRYGLAQLYQIRGRVGRSKVRAYAYLTLPPNRTLTRQAVKRLEVMQKLDTLGAGFMLASHDMDIRGFGNLLGDEQSGNIREVGVELYQTMLQEAIEELKALGEGETESRRERISPKLSLGISSLIPESYVPDLTVRLGLYRRMGGLESEGAIESFAAELVDRFGAMPKETEQLIASMKLKLLCMKLNISKLDVGPKGASIQFFNQTFANPEKLIDFVTRNPHDIRLKGEDQSLGIKNQAWDKVEDRLKGVKRLLEQLAGLDG